MTLPVAVTRDELTERTLRSLETRYEYRGGCRIWLGHLSSSGYGEIFNNGRKLYTHRAQYAKSYGRADGVIRHICDTPACINPVHLRQGTQYDNCQDAVRRRVGKRPMHSISEYLEVEHRLCVLGESVESVAKSTGWKRQSLERIRDGVYDTTRLSR